METALIGLAALACPVGMGAMIWFMARGLRKGPEEPRAEASIEELRAEHRRIGHAIEQRERPPADAGLFGAR